MTALVITLLAVLGGSPTTAAEVAPLPSTLYPVRRISAGVRHLKGPVLGVGVHVVEVLLSDPEVRVAVALPKHGIRTDESFGRMVSRTRPAVAITGTFFSTRSRIPTGDLVVNGRVRFRGFAGPALGITEGNLATIFPTARGKSSIDWDLYDTVIRGGPTLVRNGAVALDSRSEGFRTLPASARRRRTALGLTADNRLLLLATREGITLWELAKVGRALGFREGFALDGGTSTGLYVAGSLVLQPGRRLTNLLVVYHQERRWRQYRGALAGR